MESALLKTLSIAGSDPSAGAGVQLDLKIFERLGVYGMTVITTVTAQNTRGIQKINAVPPRIIAAQMDSIVRDIGTDACKIGMLYDPTAVSIVANRIARREIPNIVLDPVLAAKDGTPFLSVKGIKYMKKYLIPQVLVLTPNLIEAEILTGITIKTTNDVKQAAGEIHKTGCRYVLIKGGHLKDEPIDILFDGSNFLEIPGIRIQSQPVHGTGCAFSAALAARIAHGDSVPDAALFAKSFVSELIRTAVKLGKGFLLIR